MSKYSFLKIFFMGLFFLSWVEIGMGTSTLELNTDQKIREIVIETKKLADGKVHWVPERVEVFPGEKIQIALKHEFDGGFEIHGLYIPALQITKEVKRHEPTTISATVPLDLKVGEYKIGCFMHETHMAATLVVKKEKAKK